MENEIREFLTKSYPDIDFACDALIDDGILDSLVLVEMLSALSLEYGIIIPYEEIIPENFNSVKAIASLVEKLKKA